MSKAIELFQNLAGLAEPTEARPAVTSNNSDTGSDVATDCCDCNDCSCDCGKY